MIFKTDLSTISGCQFARFQSKSSRLLDCEQGCLETQKESHSYTCRWSLYMTTESTLAGTNPNLNAFLQPQL